VGDHDSRHARHGVILPHHAPRSSNNLGSVPGFPKNVPFSLALLASNYGWYMLHLSRRIRAEVASAVIAIST